MPRDVQQQHTWPCRTLVMLQLSGISVWRGQSDPRDGGEVVQLSVAQENGSQQAPAAGKLQRKEQSREGEVLPAGMGV